MISAIINMYRKSAAAVLVQMALERFGWYLPEGSSPAKLANDMVGEAWDRRPDLFAGHFGARPHKFSVAAVSLAEAIQREPLHSPSRRSYALCLAKVLEQHPIWTNAISSGDSDDVLLREAAEVFDLVANEYTADTKIPELFGFKGQSGPSAELVSSSVKEAAGECRKIVQAQITSRLDPQMDTAYVRGYMLGVSEGMRRARGLTEVEFVRVATILFGAFVGEENSSKLVTYTMHLGERSISHQARIVGCKEAIDYCESGRQPKALQEHFAAKKTKRT